MKKMALLLAMLMTISAVYPVYAEESCVDFAETAADDLLPAEAEITGEAEMTDEAEIADEASAEDMAIMSVDTNKSVYKASDAWEALTTSTKQAPVYNGHTEWKWERYDAQSKWTNFAAFRTDKSYFGTTPGEATITRTAGNAWTAQPTSDWSHPAIGEGWMQPYCQKGHPDYAVSRAFTAPKSGVVTLSTEDGFIYGGSSKPIDGGNRPAFVRITLNGAQIWPKGSEGIRLPDTTEQKYEFTPMDVTLSQNDVLRFEVYNGDTGAQYSKLVWWQPVVTYSYEPQSISPANTDGVPLDQTFTLTFADELEPMTKDDVSISGGASVKSFSHSGNTITVDFDGLEGETEYTVSISGIKIKGTTEELFSGFSFKTMYVYKKPAYKASEAWSNPKDGTTGNTYNGHTEWKWLYRNNTTKNNENPYVEYTIAKAGNSTWLADPKKNADGSYDYVSEGTSNVVVYADNTNAPGMRNALGKHWARPSVAQSLEPMESAENRIVKEFTSPESGTVTISAEDMSGEAKIYNKGLKTSGNRLKGAVCRIIKKTDKEDIVLFEHSFEYTLADCPADGLGVYEFEDISTELTKGDKLWFEISSETGGSAYAKLVFWDPTISFDAVYPNITAMSPENNAEGVALNFEQRITFDYEVAEILPSDIEIDGGARAKAVWLEDGGKTLCITFDGLAPDTEYNAEIKNVRIAADADSTYRPYKLSFKTGTAVQLGDMYIEGGFKAGNNKIVIDINNAAGAEYPYTAALMAAVCKRTEKGYTVESVKTVCRDDIVQNDKLSAEVSVLNTDEYFIKAVLVQSVPSAKALTALKIFSE